MSTSDTSGLILNGLTYGRDISEPWKRSSQLVTCF